MKYILDMDIGDDIDDAIALYAAMCQGLEIIGVTTVFRNTDDRARQAKKLLMEFGQGYETVPVFAGHATPMDKEPQTFPHIHHYTPELAEDRYTPNGGADEAVDFIIDACHTYGKELIVIAIGPFTNMGRIIEKDPDALNMAAKVAIMGGAFFKQYVDWNVTCDVPAADIMFRNLNNLECIGADVTHFMEGEERLYNNLLEYTGNDKGHLYLTELCRLWRKDRPWSKLLLHDPLVVYYTIDPSLCEMKSAPIAVITEGFGIGLTLNVDAHGKRRYFPAQYEGFDPEHKSLVAAKGDRDAFNDLIFKDFDR